MSRLRNSLLALAAAALLGVCVAPVPETSSRGATGTTCEPCARWDFLCCNTPSDGNFKLTSFGGTDDPTYYGGTMACGKIADGTWHYATSWVRWSCGAKLEVTNPRTGACVVVEVADAGPHARIERAAGAPVLDASPTVCQALFGVRSCGRLPVHVEETLSTTPLGAHCNPADDRNQRQEPDPEPQREPDPEPQRDPEPDPGVDERQQGSQEDDSDPDDQYEDDEYEDDQYEDDEYEDDGSEGGDFTWNVDCWCDVAWTCERDDYGDTCSCDPDCDNPFDSQCGCDVSYSCDEGSWQEDCPCDPDCGSV